MDWYELVERNEMHISSYIYTYIYTVYTYLYVTYEIYIYMYIYVSSIYTYIRELQLRCICWTEAQY